MSKEEGEFGFPLADTKANKFSGKTAKKDHIICQNQYYFDIKKGDALDEIPECFYETLKTEQVI